MPPGRGAFRIHEGFDLCFRKFGCRDVSSNRLRFVYHPEPLGSLFEQPIKIGGVKLFFRDALGKCCCPLESFREGIVRRMSVETGRVVS